MFWDLFSTPVEVLDFWPILTHDPGQHLQVWRRGRHVHVWRRVGVLHLHHVHVAFIRGCGPLLVETVGAWALLLLLHERLHGNQVYWQRELYHHRIRREVSFRL